MNAWKGVDLSSIDPIEAFSITTSQWTLCEFPGNALYVLDASVGTQTTFGPAHSNIVGLTYGLSFLTATLLTTIIMVFGFGSRRKKPPPVPAIEQHYNPPVTPQQEAAIRAAAAEDKAKATAEVRRCADLLRQMYRLDLQIWTAEGGDDEDEAAQARLRHKADAIFAEVRRIAGRWQAGIARGEWSAEEAAPLAALCQAIAREPANRYLGGGDGRMGWIERPNGSPV